MLIAKNFLLAYIINEHLNPTGWVIGNKIVMTFASFDQSEEYRSAKKRVCSITKIVSQERKLRYKKEILKKIIYSEV